MNEFYENPRQLNKKKVISICCIILVIMIIAVILAIPKDTPEPDSNETTNAEVTESSTVFYSSDVSVSVELSNNLNLKNYNSDLGYLLELRSENDLNIFISKENVLPNKTLAEVANADKRSFIQDFNYSNLSDIKELVVNNNPAYTYSFQYLDADLKKAFYLQIVWLQVDDDYYIFDIEFPQDDLAFYTSLTSSLLASFQVLK